MTADLAPVRRALISVSDKTGLIERAKKLAEMGVELVSTGGTSKASSPCEMGGPKSVSGNGVSGPSCWAPAPASSLITLQSLP